MLIHKKIISTHKRRNYQNSYIFLENSMKRADIFSSFSSSSFCEFYLMLYVIFFFFNVDVDVIYIMIYFFWTKLIGPLKERDRWAEGAFNQSGNNVVVWIRMLWLSPPLLPFIVLGSYLFNFFFLLIGGGSNDG